VARASRNLTKALITKTLACTARGLFRIVAAVIAPCSVKAKGRYLTFLFDAVTICDRMVCASLAVSWNMKLSGNHSRVQIMLSPLLAAVYRPLL